jgi:hypothetical protein
MLKPRTACREVVRAVQALFESAGQGSVEEGPAGYVQARQRLPVERLEKALAHTARTADLARRRRVGKANSTAGPSRWPIVPPPSCRTPKRIKTLSPAFQPESQGVAFPILKFLVLFSLSSGAILRVAMGHWKNHDLRLLHGLWEALEKGRHSAGRPGLRRVSHPGRAAGQGVDVVARMHGAAAWIIEKPANV